MALYILIFTVPKYIRYKHHDETLEKLLFKENTVDINERPQQKSM
jgi:hypothetical protein